MPLLYKHYGASVFIDFYSTISTYNQSGIFLQNSLSALIVSYTKALVLSSS